MECKIKNLWQTTYEIEGLALLVKKKADNLPNDLISLLKEKISILQKIANDIENTILEKNYTQNVNVDSSNSCGPIDNHMNIVQNIIEPTYEGLDEEIDLTNNYDINNTVDVDIIDTTESIEIVNDDIDIVELDDDIVLEPATDIDSGMEKSETITLEEKLIRQNSKDLKQLFTINDRYRFRRELFGNSDTEFIDMLNLVSAMSSFVEAEEYFYSDLEWDQENEEVRDFMNIIAHYFVN